MASLFNCTGHDWLIPDMVRGQGITVWDAMGRAYLDFESGVWAASLGHNHEAVIHAIETACQGLMHSGFAYLSPVTQLAAEAVLEIAGCRGGSCVFLSSGGEAVELARQMARHETGRHTTLVLHDAYLGAYMSARERQEHWHIFNWEACRQCSKHSTCDDRCPKIAAIPSDVAEFVFEPGSAAGYVRFPPRGLVRHMAAKVRSGGGRIVVNEVTTGMGRTGAWLASEYYDLQPDLVALGKGLGSGYPVSATVLSAEMTEAMHRRGGFRYAQSHQNDPMGAHVALAVIDVIKKENFLAKAQHLGSLLGNLLRPLISHPGVEAVRGQGLMWAVDIPDPLLCRRVYEGLIKRGLLVCCRGDCLRIDPPLVVTDAQLQILAAALDEEIHLLFAI